MQHHRLDWILSEVEAEMLRAESKHPGTADLPDGTGGGARATWEAMSKNACNRAAREGRLTFCHVLEEEVSEALAETDPARLRTELVQVMNVAVRWVMKLDREKARRAEAIKPIGGGRRVVDEAAIRARPFRYRIVVRSWSGDPGHTAYAMGLSRHHPDDPAQAVRDVVEACRRLMISWARDGVPFPKEDAGDPFLKVSAL